MAKLRLYHYWRSSSSWRVRWALNLKGVTCEYVPVSLLDGESESEEHRRRNPMGYVPALEITDGSHARILTESLAMIEWLEETYPQPSLLPGDAFQRAQIRALAETINAGTQPIQNLSVMLAHSDDPAEQKRWGALWTRNGLQAYEALVRQTAGKFSVGDQITLADLCLIPQCYNAKRQEVSLDSYPTVARIFAAALATESCQAAAPERFEPPQK